MCPPAKTMTMREAPIARGARPPAPGDMTVLPTVKTRKNVPMNSTRYFFIFGVARAIVGGGAAQTSVFLLRAGRIRASLPAPMTLRIPEGDFAGYIFDL